MRYLAQPTPPHPGRASASAAPRAPAAVRSQGGNTAVVAVGDVTGNGGGRVVEQPGVREDDGTGDAAEVVGEERGGGGACLAVRGAVEAVGGGGGVGEVVEEAHETGCEGARGLGDEEGALVAGVGGAGVEPSVGGD